ncbi:hypothetical protein J1N35_013863, partial [Gossypium stocksii]
MGKEQVTTIRRREGSIRLPPVQERRILEGKEQLKVIGLCLGKVLGNPKNPTQEENKEDFEDLQENPQPAKIKPEPDEAVKSVAELEKERIMEYALTRVPFPLRLEDKLKWDE